VAHPHTPIGLSSRVRRRRAWPIHELANASKVNSWIAAIAPPRRKSFAITVMFDSDQTGSFGKTAPEVHDLHRLAACAFHQVIFSGSNHEIFGARIVDCRNINPV